MEKFVSIVLTICLVFLVNNTIWSADVRSEEKLDALSLRSVSEFKNLCLKVKM